jgi:hypothetical protein
MPPARPDQSIARAGQKPATIKEKKNALAASQMPRKAFLQIANIRDMACVELERFATKWLTEVTDVVLGDEEAVKGKNNTIIASEGHTLPLYMLSKEPFKSRLSEANAAARTEFPSIFGHQNKALNSFEASPYPNDNGAQILQLTNDERDTLLYKFWRREQDRLIAQTEAIDPDEPAIKSPQKTRRRAAGPAVEAPEKISTRGTKAPSTPRLYNSELTIIEVLPLTTAPDEPGPGNNYNEYPTGRVTRIPFMDFCDSGNYQEIIRGEATGDLDTALFSVKKLCELVEKDGKFSFVSGRLTMRKKKKRFQARGTATKERYIKNWKDIEAEHVLEKMLEQLVKGAKYDTEAKFEMKWKVEEFWGISRMDSGSS